VQREDYTFASENTRIMKTNRTLSTCTAIMLMSSLAFGPLTGCASQTTITSQPSQARLKIDGQPVGKTPYNFNDPQVWIWTKHQVTLEKRGYLPTQSFLTANFSATHVIVGILCCLPLVLVGQYDPQVNYVMNKSSSSSGPVEEVWRAVQEGGKSEVVEIDFQQ